MLFKVENPSLESGKHITDCFSHSTSFFLAGFNMDTKSLIAIVCVVIAIVILLSLTIYTVVTAWRKIRREHTERQQCRTAAAHSYKNEECIKNEHTKSDNNFTEDMGGGTSSDYEKITPDRCQTADPNDSNQAAIASTHGGQSTAESVPVHVETKDTRF